MCVLPSAFLSVLGWHYIKGAGLVIGLGRGLGLNVLIP